MVQQSLKCQYNLASQDAKHRWVDALLTQSQLRWSGHLVRMQDNRLPKQLFYSEQTEGHRSRGRPKLRYKDTLKKSLQKCDIDEEQWETMATNRYAWRQAIRKGTEGYENERQRKQVEKRVVVRARINCTEHRGGFTGGRSSRGRPFQFVRDFFCQNIQ